jgi:hypothetical protein
MCVVQFFMFSRHQHTWVWFSALAEARHSIVLLQLVTLLISGIRLSCALAGYLVPGQMDATNHRYLDKSLRFVTTMTN